MDSNHDELIQSLNTPRLNINPESILRHPSAPAVVRGAEGGILDTDLARLVEAWPTLPEPLKAAIRAIVGTVAGSKLEGAE